MAKLNIRKLLSRFGEWLGGSLKPRKLAVAPRELPPIPVPEPDLRPAPEPEIRRVDNRAPDLPERPVGGVSPLTRRERVKVARTFDSAHPVRTRNELFGRSDELDTLLTATLDLGQHVIIHGARGSGKTSLVRVYGDYADQHRAIVIYMACEPGASFADLVRPYLHALPAAALTVEERTRFRQAVAALPENFGPRAFVDVVAERVVGTVVFIFDEFDRITDSQVKGEMAIAMKLLSDALSNVLFMLVGIAHNVADVIECHPSLRRHMRVVSLGRIEPDSVDALIDAGELSTGLAFQDDAREVITRASCGSPFHVRMFCQHAAIAALARASSSVSRGDAHNGLHAAILQWAAMNAEDAQHFVALVERESLLPEIERIARAAALGDRLPSDGDNVRTLLGASLMTEESSRSLVFRDSVAPQFLIAYAILAEASASADSGRSPWGATL